MTNIDVVVEDMQDAYSVVVIEKNSDNWKYSCIAHIFYGTFLDKSQAKSWAEKIANYHRKEWENNG